jgi:hypothetical protein
MGGQVLLQKMLELDNDEKFQDLSYRGQVEVRSKIASDYLAVDDQFKSLSPRAQYEVLGNIVLTRPALRDKDLEVQALTLSQGAKKGDKKALKYMSNLVAQSSLINSSMLTNFFGTKLIAPLIAHEKDVVRSPELEASQFWAANPRDRMRLSDFFEAEIAPDEDMSRRTSLLKIASTVLPTMAEFLMLLPITGGSAAPVGLGKLAMRGIISAASKATSPVKIALWGLAGAAAHASTTAAIGVLRENMLAVLNQAPKDANIADLLKKNAKWFGGYFLGDALMNMATDTVWPLLRGAKLAFLPKGQHKAYYEGLNDEGIQDFMRRVISGANISTDELARYPKAAQLATDNMRTTVAVNRFLPSAEPEKIFTMLANSNNYAVAQSIKSKAIQLYETGMGSSMDFADFKAATAWLSQTYEQAGRTRMFPVLKPQEVADVLQGKTLLKNVVVEGLPATPASMSRKAFEKYVHGNWETQGYASSQAMLMDYGGALLERRFGLKLSDSNENWLKAVADEWSIDTKKLDVVWDNGTNVSKNIDGRLSENAWAITEYNYETGNYRLDFSGMKDIADQKLVIAHELRHVKDHMYGWKWAQEPGQPHMTGYQDFNVDYIHKLAASDALRQGYQINAGLMKDYPDLLPRMMQAPKLSEPMLKTYTAASQHIEIREVLKGNLPLADSKRLELAAKLVAVNPTTLEYDRVNLQQFVKEYARISGAPEENLNRLLVDFVKAPVESTSNVRGSYAADKMIRIHSRENPKDFLELPLKIDPAVGEGRYLQNIMQYLDSLDIYPTKMVGKQAAVTVRPYDLGKVTIKDLKVTARAKGTSRRGVSFAGEPIGWVQKNAPKEWEFALTSGTIKGGNFAMSPVDLVRGKVATAKGALEGVLTSYRTGLVSVHAKGKLQGIMRQQGTVYTGLGGELTGKSLRAASPESLAKGLQDILMPQQMVRTQKTLMEKGFARDFPKLLAKQQVFSPEWVNYAAGTLQNASVKFDNATGKVMLGIHEVAGDLASPVVREASFDSYEALARTLIAQTVDEPYLRTFLNRQGLSLKLDPTNKELQVYLRKAPTNVLYKGKNIEDLLTNNPEIMPKIPSDLGPQVAIVIPGKQVEVQYKNGLLAGNYEDILKEFDSFEDRVLSENKTYLKATGQGYLSGSKLSKQLEVFIPEINERRVFNDMASMKGYLEGGWKDFEEIRKTALHKGLRIVPENGKWLAYDSTGKAILLNSTEALHARIAEVPTPEWMPELSGYIGHETFAKPAEGTFPPELLVVNEPKTRLGKQWDTVSQYWRGTVGWFESHTAKGGDPNLLKGVMGIEDIRGVMRGQDNELGQLAHTIFLDTNQKPMKLERRVFIGEWFRASDADKPAVVLARGLTETELNAGRLLRQLWGVKPGEGLHGKFGVAGFLQDYFPKMNKHFLGNPQAKYTDGSINEYLKDVFGQNVPKEIDAFFQHTRVSDVLALSQELDPLAAVIRYGAIGHRELLLKDTWGEVVKLVTESTDEVGKLRMWAYMSDVMGLPQGGFEKAMKESSLAALQKFGIEQGLGMDLIKFFTGMSYMSTMGFKPLLPIRNMLQVYNVLAPSLGPRGNHWVKLAIQKVAKDVDGSLFDHHRAMGTFAANLPVAGGEETLKSLGPETFMGKFLNKGMSWYRNSDEWSRVVAYEAAGMRFDDALQRYQASLKGGLNMPEQNFLELAGLNSVPPQVKDQALELARNGQWGGLRGLYTSHMTNWTMFPYRAGMSPMAFRGVVGKLFGMMGHYPLYYVENIRRNLKYGSAAGKATFVASWLWNSAAIIGAMQYGLGIKAQDFLPWTPMQFTGGPVWQLGINTLSGLAPGQRGAQARADVWGITIKDGVPNFNPTKGRMFQSFVPGAFELRKLVDAAKFAEAGKPWHAFLSATGGTPVPSWIEGGP